MIIVFDLDGTLSNCEHRMHYIHGETKDWNGFYEASAQDAPHTELIETARQFIIGGHQVEVWTGRSDIVRTKTEGWLSAYGLGNVTKILMRKDGDYKPDHVLKQQWLNNLFPCERPSLVFEDRSRVVQMWRENGIRCCQVSVGDF